MAREVWVYPDKGPKYLLTRAVRSSVGRETDSTLPFKERMRKNLYTLECEQGSRFRVPGYGTDTLKKVWNE